ncbi:MAG: oligosaccharide flippase family protein [Synergistaceae bacterium]|nr:oligosaccharide flippase family protein [Synergistaceae bacterium]
MITEKKKASFHLIKKYKDLPVQIKAAFWFIVCNFMVKGIVFISTPLFTRILSTEDYGIVAVFNSYQQVILIFATFELSLGAYTKGYIKYDGRTKEFTTNLIIIGNIITFLCWLPFILIKDYFLKLTGVDTLCLLLMFVLFLVQPSYQCWMYRERYNYKYELVVIMTLLSATVTTFVPLYFVAFVSNSAKTKVAVTLICGVLFSVPFYISSLVSGGMVRERKFFLDNLRFCLTFQTPLVVHSLSFLILGQSDRMMISEMVGRSEAAIYSVSYSLAVVVSIFQSSINQVFQPYRYQKMQEGDDTAIRNTTNSLLILFAGMIINFILIAPETIGILFPKYYYDAIWVIPPVSVGIFFIFLYSIFVDVESFYEKTKYVMYASIVCAVTNIFLNYVGIKSFGYIACAYTTLISYILFAVMHYTFMKRTCRECGIDKKYFDIKRITAISSLVTIFGVGLAFLYPYIALRYVIFAIVIIVIFIKKNEIKKLISIRKEN